MLATPWLTIFDDLSFGSRLATSEQTRFRIGKHIDIGPHNRGGQNRVELFQSRALLILNFFIRHPDEVLC